MNDIKKAIKMLEKLSCKVGNTVHDVCCNKIDIGNVISIDCYIVCDNGTYELKDFGKTVFLTREEAEKALGGNK